MHTISLPLILLLLLHYVFAALPNKQYCIEHISLIRKITAAPSSAGLQYCSSLNGVPPPTKTDTTTAPVKTLVETVINTVTTTNTLSEVKKQTE